MSYPTGLKLLVLFILTVHLSGELLADPEESFVCTNEFEQPDMIKKFAIDEEDMYFFLADKSVRVRSLRYFYKRPKDGTKKFYLNSGKITVRIYDTVTHMPDIMLNPQIGLVQTRLGEDGGWSRSYVIIVNQTNNEIDIPLLTFSSGSVGFFETTKAPTLLIDNIVKTVDTLKNSTFTFVWLDSFKQLALGLNNYKPNANLHVIHTQKQPRSEQFEHTHDIKLSSLPSFIGYLQQKDNLNTFIANLVMVNGSQITIQHIEFEANSPGITIQDETLEISLSELFNCRKPFKMLRQVKGLFYSDGVFYVFIDDYYLMAKGDEFVKYGFFLRDQDYVNARRIDKIFSMARPEWLQTKWLKTLRNNSFLVLGKSTFALRAREEAGSQQLEASSEVVEDFSQCEQQTLEVEGRVFCFNKKIYYLLPDLNSTQQTEPEKEKNISSIFQPAGVQLDEELQFIFNYENNTFIMMTESEFFTLAYEQLLLDEELNVAIRAGTELKRQKNCLFNVTKGHCPLSDFPTLPTEMPTLTTQSVKPFSQKNGTNDDKDDDERLSKMKGSVIVGTIILTIIAIILVLCCCTGYKKRGSKLSRTGSNSNQVKSRSSSVLNLSPSLSSPMGSGSGSKLPLTKSNASPNNRYSKPEKLPKSNGSLTPSEKNSKPSISPTNSKSESIRGTPGSNADSITFKSDFDQAKYKGLKSNRTIPKN